MTSSKRILFVDDEAAFRTSTEAMLRRAGYQVLSAGNRKDAMRHLRSGSFDLAFLAVHLPDMDGLQLMEEVRRICPETPVILVTEDTSPRTISRINKSGVRNCIFKPVDPAEFAEFAEIIFSGGECFC